MKKTYMQPSTVEVKIETLSMIAASGEANPLFSPEEETTTMDSRRNRSIWGDDEEEDY